MNITIKTLEGKVTYSLDFDNENVEHQTKLKETLETIFQQAYETHCSLHGYDKNKKENQNKETLDVLFEYSEDLKKYSKQQEKAVRFYQLIADSLIREKLKQNQEES